MVFSGTSLREHDEDGSGEAAARHSLHCDCDPGLRRRRRAQSDRRREDQSVPALDRGLDRFRPGPTFTFSFSPGLILTSSEFNLYLIPFIPEFSPF